MIKWNSLPTVAGRDYDAIFLVEEKRKKIVAWDVIAGLYLFSHPGVQFYLQSFYYLAAGRRKHSLICLYYWLSWLIHYFLRLKGRVSKMPKASSPRKLCSEPNLKGAYNPTSCVQLTVIFWEVLYEATLASLVLFRA